MDSLLREIIAVLCTEGGGVEDFPAGGYCRILHWDTQSGRLVLSGENHHGLDFAVHYWWCTVGNALANGDLRAQLKLLAMITAPNWRTTGFRSTQLNFGLIDWRTSRV